MDLRQYRGIERRHGQAQRQGDERRREPVIFLGDSGSTPALGASHHDGYEQQEIPQDPPKHDDTH